MADILAKCISNHQLKCEDSKLTELAAHVRLVDIDPQLTIAQFHGVSLSSVPEALFHQLTNITSISFYSVPLTSVPEALFEGLRSLQHMFEVSICSPTITSSSSLTAVCFPFAVEGSTAQS
eukprot:TRINITY_DN6286_c0_g1_i1.p1 TRINITY_DN6286_c0_g1~~TRINITY_DN6286_c0_g1_i1.p1  ORF type:complete len:121 (+),score=15.68 TRINITY_DN6286_c0_g1_i1:33-395(+)